MRAQTFPPGQSPGAVSTRHACTHPLLDALEIPGGRLLGLLLALRLAGHLPDFCRRVRAHLVGVVET